MQFQGSHGYASNRFFKLTQTFKLGHRTSMTDSFWNLYILHCKYQVIPHSSPWFLLMIMPELIEITSFVCTNK